MQVALDATSLSPRLGSDPGALTPGVEGSSLSAAFSHHPAFPKEPGRDPGTGDDGGDTRARSCRSRWESDRFRLRSSILGPLAPASPRCRQCIIHTSVPIYIPASSPGPACDGLWPLRSWDHAAISICSRCLPAQGTGIGNRCGSVQQERPDRCASKDLGG